MGHLMMSSSEFAGDLCRQGALVRCKKDAIVMSAHIIHIGTVKQSSVSGDNSCVPDSVRSSTIINRCGGSSDESAKKDQTRITGFSIEAQK